MNYLRCAGAEIGDWKHSQGKENQFDLCDDCFTVFNTHESKHLNSWLLFAGQREDGKFHHFYSSEMLVRFCGEKKIVKTKLTLDPEGLYWGWLFSHHPQNHNRGSVAFIYPAEVLVEICFAYGTKAETKRGRGKVVRLKVEII